MGEASAPRAAQPLLWEFLSFEWKGQGKIKPKLLHPTSKSWLLICFFLGKMLHARLEWPGEV